MTADLTVARLPRWATPPAPAFSNPNEVSLTVYDPGCCGAHYSLLQSRAPDPRLLAFVTADEYAKKLEALDTMFVAQTSGARLPEKLKRHRCVVALVFLTLLACIVAGAVTSVMFAQDQNDWKCAEKEGVRERHRRLRKQLLQLLVLLVSIPR